MQYLTLLDDMNILNGEVDECPIEEKLDRIIELLEDIVFKIGSG